MNFPEIGPAQTPKVENSEKFIGNLFIFLIICIALKRIQYLSYGRYAAVSTDNDIIWYFGGHGCNGPSTTAMGGIDGSCVSEE